MIVLLDLFPYVGKIRNIGGAEGLGISIHNISGSTVGLALVSGYGSLTSGSQRTSSTLVTPDDRYGGGYEPQDVIRYESVIYILGIASVTYSYNAHTIFSSVQYNANFANLSGNARLFYGHNWNSTSISSIGLSNTGVSITMQPNNNGWGPAYSSSRVFTNGG